MRNTFNPRKRIWITAVLCALPHACGPAPTLPDAATDAPPAAPARAQPLEAATYAGRLADGNTFIAVVTGGAAIRAYVCDGVTDTWFDGGAMRLPALVTAPDGSELYLRAEASGVAGSVRRPGGAEQTFRAARTQTSALFRAEAVVGEDRYLGGWIVLPDGAQRGVVREGSAFVPSSLMGSTPVAEAAARAVEFLAPARFEPDALQRRTTNTLAFNIAGLGDSYASGEGAPEEQGNHNGDGLADAPGERAEVWDRRARTRSEAQGYVPPDFTERAPGVPASVPLSPAPTEEDLATVCHRSGRNGTRRAAEILHAEWPRANVNAESFACSGAKILHLVAERDAGGSDYRGPDGSDQRRLGVRAMLPQVEQLRRSLRASRRPLDALTVGIGGNDLNFATLIAACLADPGCHDDIPLLLPGLTRTPRRLIADGRAGVDGEPGAAEKFRRLAVSIDNLRAVRRSEVLLVDVPNLVRHHVAGTPASQTDVCEGVDMIGFGATRSLVTQDETNFIDADVMPVFRDVLGDARRAHGWTLVNAHVATSSHHGLCAGGASWFGTLLSGLERQGADIDVPRELETVIQAFVGGDADPDGFPFHISGGLGHPNLAYHVDGLGPAIADSLRPLLRAHVRPLAPINLRVSAQRFNGDISVRWDDRATTETEFRVRVRRVNVPGAAGTDAGATTQPDGEERLRDPDMDTEYTIAARGRAAYDVDVRACHVGRDVSFEECSAYTPALRVTNFAPTVVPTGLTARNEVCPTALACFPARMAWAPVADPTGAHVFYEVDLDGRRFITQGTFLEESVGTSFKVRSCNLVGCGPFSPPHVAPRRATLTTGISAHCQSLRATQRLPGEPTLDPAGLCR